MKITKLQTDEGNVLEVNADTGEILVNLDEKDLVKLKQTKMTSV